MNTFLDNISDLIIEKHKGDFSNLCVVFPSKRAGLHFKNTFGKKFDSPVWSPSVFSIEDFIKEMSGYVFADSLILLIELFTVYKEVVSEEKTVLENGTEFIEDSESDENFDSFYMWGEMLLKDFDIVDKYLVDAGVLFKRIKDLKEIEESFPIELHDAFKKFWGTLFNTNSSLVKENFLKIWQILESLYRKFRERLNEKNICYPGMAYRKLYDELKTENTKIGWKKIIFAGFNSLSTSEKNIMQMLAGKGIAEIYWDADEYYYSDNKQEAGNFLRMNVKYFGQDGINFDSDLLNSEKNINVIGISSTAGMAKVFGSELKILTGDRGFHADKTVVVLPEENLLMPVLYSVPEEIKNLNVTMGMPFRDTPLYGLINLIFELQDNCIFEKGKYKFHHAEVEKILLHPYVKFSGIGNIYNIINHIKDKNIVYFSVDEYKGEIPEIVKIIFKKISVSGEIKPYLSGIIDYIAGKIESDKSGDANYKKYQFEYIYNFYEYFNRFNDAIGKLIQEISTETYRRILKNLLSNVTIPFTGEPLKGLQIMGMLETRNIDFENVFIVSVNEGVLPKGNAQNSFIPYSLRKAMRIPTYEEEDSITAYYFYRLLQKAKNIYLIYNTDIGNNTKEKSRYILQIENELITRNNKINYNNKIVIPEPFAIEKKSIEIVKDENVLNKLKELKNFSPSSLNKYINCSLQFYFDKIAGLKEDEFIEETFDSKLIGNVIHKILEDIYQPYKGEIIDGKSINEIAENIESNYRDILEKAVRDCESGYVLNEFGGKNLLFSDIIYQLLKRVLENEKEQVPFKIISLEEGIKDVIVFESGNVENQINIEGRIDRIDENEGVTRILDYKTGGFELKKFSEEFREDYFTQLITNPDYKENFQAFFYGYFYSKQNKEKKINVGIYPIKRMKDGVHILKERFIENELFEMFGMYFTKLLKEIFNPDIPFKQTGDEKRCSYCPYSGICYRDLKNTI